MFEEGEQYMSRKGEREVILNSQFMEQDHVTPRSRRILKVRVTKSKIPNMLSFCFHDFTYTTKTYCFLSASCLNFFQEYNPVTGISARKYEFCHVLILNIFAFRMKYDHSECVCVGRWGLVLVQQPLFVYRVVVYFDQRLGAAHTERRSKQLISAFFVQKT